MGHYPFKATWIAPAPDENANPVEGEGEDYTVTCTIDDGELPRITAPDESGTHDDEPLKREVSIEVVPSYCVPLFPFSCAELSIVSLYFFISLFRVLN